MLYKVSISAFVRFMSRESKTVQYQNWVFTAFQDPSGKPFTDESCLAKVPFGPPIAAAQWSVERCEKTGRLHLQGMLRMATRTVFSTVKFHLQKLCPGAHIKNMKGTWDQNLSYTSKERTHVAGPFRYNVRDPDAPFKRTVEYWFGKPCTGKGTEARQYLESKGYQIYHVAKSEASNGTWLSGYSGQEGVIMDEVDVSWFGESNWKKVLDRMPQTLPAGSGGKTCEWTPVHIIMISNYLPPPLFRSEAFKTRIHKIRFIDREPYKLPETELDYDENDPAIVAAFTKRRKTNHPSLFVRS